MTGVHSAALPMWTAAIPARVSRVRAFYSLDDFASSDEAISPGRWITLCDAAVTKAETTRRLLAALRSQQRTDSHAREVLTLSVKAGDTHKTLKEATRLILRLLDHTVRPSDTFLIVGGGSTMNLGSFVAAMLHRGEHPFVLAPTTVLAMADVAVGSKASVNLTRPKPPAGKLRAFKHAVGLHANPRALVFLRDFVSDCPSPLRRAGLSECLKHGLLQDEALFTQCAELMLAVDPPAASCFDAALQTMALKSEALEADPFERAFARILLYGHLHAHALERATDFRVPHASSVLWGMLVELKLAGAEPLYERLLSTLTTPARTRRKSSQLASSAWFRVNRARLRAAYQQDLHDDVRRYDAIRLESVGQYASPTSSPLSTRRASETDILSAVDAVNSSIQERRGTAASPQRSSRARSRST